MFKLQVLISKEYKKLQPKPQKVITNAASSQEQKAKNKKRIQPTKKRIQAT